MGNVHNKELKNEQLFVMFTVNFNPTGYLNKIKKYATAKVSANLTVITMPNCTHQTLAFPLTFPYEEQTIAVADFSDLAKKSV